MLDDLDNVEVHRFPNLFTRNKSYKLAKKFFQFNVTSIVDVQIVGMYLKVHCDGRKGNL
jgi:hypothetical protein